MLKGYSTHEKLMVALVGSVVLFFIYSFGQAYYQVPLEMKSEVVIDASPEEIWPFIEKSDKRPIWQWKIIHVNDLSLQKMEVGSRQWIFYSYYEHKWDGEEVVTAYEENKLWAATRTSTRTDAVVAIGLSQAKGSSVMNPKTKVTYAERVLEKNFDKRINFFFEGRKAQRHTDDSLKRLKELVEEERNKKAQTNKSQD